MCGIAGLVSPHLGPDALQRAAHRMADALSHRGPDGDGFLHAPGIAFGHRRLSIIDLAGGAQPMRDRRGHVIVTNGELYNYRELRAELAAAGERFTTDSDTEVFLKAFIHWGIESLTRFNGIYAAAIYDENTRELVLIRDRLGVKPLYLADTPEGLVFASEIDALLASGHVAAERDLTDVPFYLTHLYFPRENVPYRSIRRLAPGTYLRYRDGQSVETRYWDIAAHRESHGSHRATADDRAETESLISDAVRMQKVSDVPLGAFLSGGLDSGLVTAHLAMAEDTQIKTFTVDFADGPEGFSEAAAARSVAERYGTEHHVLEVRGADLLEHWSDLLQAYGHPFADSSQLPTFLLSRFARESVAVALSGDGGDELFGGYGNYIRFLQFRQIQRMAGRFGHPALAGAALAVAARGLKAVAPQQAARVARASEYLRIPSCDLYGRLCQMSSFAALGEIAGPALRDTLDNGRILRLSRLPEPVDLDTAMVHDLNNYLVDDVLQKVDIASMAVGLEVRVPLLDHRLVEKAVTISWQDKVSTGGTKLMLRDLCRDILPSTVVQGRKQGFSVPLDSWFRGPLKSVAKDVLLSPAARARGILDPKAVERLLTDHGRGRANHGGQIWALMALELWLSNQSTRAAEPGKRSAA